MSVSSSVSKKIELSHSIELQGHIWWYSKLVKKDKNHKKEKIHFPQSDAFAYKPHELISIKLEHEKYGALYSTFSSFNLFWITKKNGRVKMFPLHYS